MNTQHLLNAVRTLEVERSVTVAHLAHALDTSIPSLQETLEALVAVGALHTSTLKSRPHAGADFTTRSVWYHTPECETTARFGPIFDPCGPHEAPGLAMPELSMAS